MCISSLSNSWPWLETGEPISSQGFNLNAIEKAEKNLNHSRELGQLSNQTFHSFQCSRGLPRFLRGCGRRRPASSPGCWCWRTPPSRWPRYRVRNCCCWRRRETGSRGRSCPPLQPPASAPWPVELRMWQYNATVHSFTWKPPLLTSNQGLMALRDREGW